MAEQRIRISIEGPVATITAARPEKLNAFDIDMLKELSAACDTIDALMRIEPSVAKIMPPLSEAATRLARWLAAEDFQSVRVAITKLGYAADSLPPDAKARKELPACCQKEGCGLPVEKKR